MMVWWGIEKVDEEGWLVYVIGMNEVKLLYEKSGFVMVDSVDMGYGVVFWFMWREIRLIGDKYEVVFEFWVFVVCVFLFICWIMFLCNEISYEIMVWVWEILLKKMMFGVFVNGY